MLDAYSQHHDSPGPARIMTRPGRRKLEASVVATASSIDGRRFIFQRSAHDLDIPRTGARARLLRATGAVRP